jgi:hypothetical protein
MVAADRSVPEKLEQARVRRARLVAALQAPDLVADLRLGDADARLQRDELAEQLRDADDQIAALERKAVAA